MKFCKDSYSKGSRQTKYDFLLVFILLRVTCGTKDRLISRTSNKQGIFIHTSFRPSLLNKVLCNVPASTVTNAGWYFYERKSDILGPVQGVFHGNQEFLRGPRLFWPLKGSAQQKLRPLLLYIIGKLFSRRWTAKY